MKPKSAGAILGLAAIFAVLHGKGAGSLIPASVGGILPQTVAAIPVGGNGSQQQFAHDFLASLHAPETACNVNAMLAWENAEGGGVTNSASFNYLNTKMPEPGSWDAVNGVQGYPSYREGVEANVAAVTNGLYGGILSALRAGNNAQAVANAVASSPWGTSWFEASC